MARLFDTDDELTGEVLGRHYGDPASGFGVVEVLPEGNERPARCVGPLADLVEGQTVRLVGRWGDHAQWGPTFEATLYEQVVPTSVAGLRSFLLSERFEVDVATVETLLAVFGETAGRVIEHEPARLEDEAGLGPDLATHLHEQWVAGLALAELVRLTQPAGVPLEVARAAHARYGAQVARTVREDPYALLAVERCRFGHADALAGHLGLEARDARRLAAGAVAALRAAQRRDGHQYLEPLELARAAADLLDVDLAAASRGVELAVERGALARDTVVPAGGDGTPLVGVYTRAGLRAERGLAEDLERLLGASASRLRPHADAVTPAAELTAGQAEAVRLVFRSPVAVLTGGPGTGKTRTIQEVAVQAEAVGLNVALCAPTGRAAKRIEELVGRPASTVHRLLEARRVAGEGFVFRYGREEHLPLDLVVADEFSMCDTALAARLVAAVDDGAHLLVVGDPDQLPPVGPGDVLRDCLAVPGIPHVRLTEVHRQAARSRIVALANEIDRGEVGELPGVDGDVFVAEESRGRVTARVVEAVAARVPAFFGVPTEDVQVVAPLYRGPAGVDALNGALKQALNPGEGQPEVAGLQVGDRVMQTRNDTELDVSNGDVGTVVDLAPTAGTLRVRFPRGEVTYARARARDLRPAWAVSVHKSQGGEWPVVVFVCDHSHRSMLWRNLVYTAVTRAQRALIVVGQASALREAAGHDRPRNRRTLLAARLAHLARSTDRPETEVLA